MGSLKTIPRPDTSMNHNSRKHGLSMEWLCPDWRCCGTSSLSTGDRKDFFLHSQAPSLFHDPSVSCLRFSPLLVSLLLLISHHRVQSRRLGHSQCLESQQLGSVPLSSDNDAETEHKPLGKGWGIEYAYVGHSLHASCSPTSLYRWACISIRLWEQMGLLEPDPVQLYLSPHPHALTTPDPFSSPWEVHDSQVLITFAFLT